METSERVSELGSVVAGRVVPKGALLMSFKLTVGRVARAGNNLHTNEAIVSVAGNEGIVNDGWLYHALPSVAAGGITDTAVKGSTLNKHKLERLFIAVPPMREQRRIAEILDTIDETIQAAERVIEKESRWGAGLADSLFKAHFATKPLGEISRRITYGFTNPMPETKTGPWMLTAADIGYGRINFSTARRTSEYAFQNALTGKSRPSENDVLITKDGTLGRVAVLGPTAVCVNQSVAVLTPRDPYDSSYVADYLLTSTGQKAMLADAGGSTIRHLYISNLGKLQIPWPDEQTRIEITSIVSASRAKVKASATHVATLKQVRVGLAADLLSGRVRTVAS
jgi:type I restriction enzyme, S subunit